MKIQTHRGLVLEDEAVAVAGSAFSQTNALMSISPSVAGYLHTWQEKIREWLKVFRRKNCAVVMATQSISDANKSGIMDVLVESCPSKIFLANHSADEDLSAELYRLAGLNE